jgi:hypothetical protein
MIIQPLPVDAITALYPGRKYLFGALPVYKLGHCLVLQHI